MFEKHKYQINFLSGICILLEFLDLCSKTEVFRGKIRVEKSYLLIMWVGKTKQDKQTSRYASVGQRWGQFSGLSAINPNILGPFPVPSLTLTSGVVLLHFEVLMRW